MIGLIIAAIWGGIALAFGSNGPEAFLSASGFLYWWYIITSGILALIMLVVSLGITGAATAGGGSEGGFLGGLLGLGAGGIISVFLFVLFAIGRGGFIVGAYLLSTAVTLAGETEPEWNITKLIGGGLLILLGLVFSKSSGSSSKSSD